MTQEHRKCWCGCAQVGKTVLGREEIPYCANHLPPHVVRFRALALAALLRGAALRDAAKKAARARGAA